MQIFLMEKGKIKVFRPKKTFILGNIKGGVLLNMEVIKILSLKQWEIGKLKYENKKYRICIYDVTNQFFFQKKL